MLMNYTLALIAVLLLQPGGHTTHASPIKTSVCEVASNPAVYNGKLVTLRAQFESDGIERSVIVDENCPQLGILPYDAADNIPGAKSLDEALATGHPSTLTKTISATFTGEFHYSPKPEMCMFVSKELCRRSIKLFEIRDLVLTMKQTK